MAEDIATLGLKVLSGDIVKATKRLDKLERQSKDNVKQNKKLKSSFSGLGTAIGALGLGLAFKSIISLTIEQERVTRQLDAAIKSTGGVAGFTTKELEKMAAGFQKVTNFGDEAILGMQSVLLTFTNLRDDVFPGATEAVLNLSERMGMDLNSAAIQLGKALNDPVANLSALSRAGIQFTKDQKDVIKGLWETGQQADAQRLILAELETQFGGSAKAARDSFGGALKSLGNAFNDLLEGDGGLDNAKGSIEELIDVLQKPETKEAFDGLVTGIVAVTTALATGAVALTTFGDSLGKFLAGGDTRTLEEIDQGIANLESRIAKFKSGLAESEDSGAIMQSLMGSPEYFKEKIQEAVIDLELLKQARDGAANAGGEDEFDKVIAIFDKQSQLIEDEISREQLKQERLKEIREKAMDQKFEEEIKIFDMQARQIEMDEFDLEAARTKAEEKLAIEQDYYERLYNMQSGSLQAGADFAKAIRDGDAKGALNNASLMLSNMAKTSKTAFKVQKAAALANAVVALPSAVMQSFNNGGGYPWGLIPAGLMLAQGLKQIQSIKSSSFGGGGAVSSVSGGSTSPSAPVASGLPPGSTATPSGSEQPAPQKVSIQLEGHGYSPEDVRNLIEEINVQITDGVELKVAA